MRPCSGPHWHEPTKVCWCMRYAIPIENTFPTCSPLTCWTFLQHCFVVFVFYPISCDANSARRTGAARFRKRSETGGRTATSHWQLQGYVVDWTRICVGIDAKQQRRSANVFVCPLRDPRRSRWHFAACQQLRSSQQIFGKLMNGISSPTKHEINCIVGDGRGRRNTFPHLPESSLRGATIRVHAPRYRLHFNRCVKPSRINTVGWHPMYAKRARMRRIACSTCKKWSMTSISMRKWDPHFCTRSIWIHSSNSCEVRILNSETFSNWNLLTFDSIARRCQTGNGPAEEDNSIDGIIRKVDNNDQIWTSA